MATANLFGAKMEVVYTNCDTLTKDESVRVYLSAVAEEGKEGESGRGEIIFDYDPNGNQNPSKIEDVGDHNVLISIGDIGSVFVQRRSWRGISIDYRIGQVRYPSVSPVGR